MKIYISPGHGGIYPGTSGNGRVEKHVNLEMALLVREYLQDYACEVTLARETDATKVIAERTKEANRLEADLVVDLHFNGFGDTSARGFETFVHTSVPKVSQTENIRKAIHNKIYSVLQGKTPDRGMKTANFQILRETKMPVVLIEYLFLTNEQDSRLIPKLKEDLAKATAAGIAEGFKIENVICRCKEYEKALAEIENILKGVR